MSQFLMFKKLGFVTATYPPFCTMSWNILFFFKASLITKYMILISGGLSSMLASPGLRWILSHFFTWMNKFTWLYYTQSLKFYLPILPVFCWPITGFENDFLLICNQVNKWQHLPQPALHHLEEQTTLH